MDQHGYKSVLGNALLLGLAFYALAILLVALDHARPNPPPPPPRRKPDFVSGHRWAKVNDVAATSSRSDIGV